MLGRWLSGWSNRRAGNNGRAAGIYVSPRSVAVAVGHLQGERYVLDLRADPIDGLDEAAAKVREQGRALGLAGAACNLVLAPELYTVSLVERPKVPDEELVEAVRWRLQDNLDFPPDQAAVDVFALPESASRERSMVFVVAAHRETLKRLLDGVYQADLRLASVDVTELALRNVAHGLYPEPHWSVGLLRLTAGSGVINISRGEELFLSRRISGIPAELSEQAWEEFNDRLLLQVQRSIDYYESAMSQPPCNALIVATTHGWQDKVCEYLDEMLPVAVRTVKDELAALFDVRLHNPDPVDIDWADPSMDQRNAMTAALPALGGVMRPLAGAAVEAAA
jgi:MSHA biogenesis protein MshI